MAEGEKTAPDWERIEADYRAGILSTREIASACGVSHTAINKRAKKDGWVRDLKAKIQAKADELVSRRMVSTEVSSQKAATERQIIEANAERIAQVRGEHRGDIQRVRSLALNLLGELEGQSASLEDLATLGELLRNPDEDGNDRRNDLYLKIISTPSRIDSAKKVAETLKHAITMEREAYGLDDKKPEQPPGEITITF
jgi:AcrR family transcriptional regulator